MADEEKQVEEIEQIEAEIRKSILNVNKLPDVIGKLTTEEAPPAVQIKSCLALSRIFGKLVTDGFLVRGHDSAAPGKKRKRTSSKEGPELKKETLKLQQWLEKKFDEAVEGIGNLLQESSDGRVQAAALHASFEFARIDETLDHGLYPRFVENVLSNPKPTEVLLQHWDSKFLCCVDVTISTLRAIKALLKKEATVSDTKGEVSRSPTFVMNTLSLLLLLSDPSKESQLQEGKFLINKGSAKKTWQNDTILGQNLKFKKLISEAWLLLFRCRLSVSAYKTVLLSMKEIILPRIEKPVLLFDFLKESYDIGGIVSLLSLEGLYNLISKHNLDYPDFFPKLYKLLTPQNLQAKHKQKFMRLLNLFLRSSKLPTYMVAAFAKRMCRLGLSADPGSCVFLLASVFNLMKRHPPCEVLVRRISKEAGALAVLDTTPFGPDPFIEAEDDMSKCRAIDSCLWEIKTLASHYSPEVVATTRFFTDENAPKHALDMTPYLNHTYSSLFKKESEHRINQRVALRYQPPKATFKLKELADFY